MDSVNEALNISSTATCGEEPSKPTEIADYNEHLNQKPKIEGLINFCQDFASSRILHNLGNVKSATVVHKSPRNIHVDFPCKRPRYNNDFWFLDILNKDKPLKDYGELNECCSCSRFIL